MRRPRAISDTADSAFAARPVVALSWVLPLITHTTTMAKPNRVPSERPGGASKLLPGEAAPDDALIDLAVAELNQIHRMKGLEAALAIGEYLAQTFFDGDPELFATHERGHASFRALSQREELNLSASSLWTSVAVLQQVRSLPPQLGARLSISHHRRLLVVKDPASKARLARSTVDEQLSVKERADLFRLTFLG